MDFGILIVLFVVAFISFGYGYLKGVDKHINTTVKDMYIHNHPEGDPFEDDLK